MMRERGIKSTIETAKLGDTVYYIDDHDQIEDAIYEYRLNVERRNGATLAKFWPVGEIVFLAYDKGQRIGVSDALFVVTAEHAWEDDSVREEVERVTSNDDWRGTRVFVMDHDRYLERDLEPGSRSEQIDGFGPADDVFAVLNAIPGIDDDLERLNGVSRHKNIRLGPVKVHVGVMKHGFGPRAHRVEFDASLSFDYGPRSEGAE